MGRDALCDVRQCEIPDGEQTRNARHSPGRAPMSTHQKLKASTSHVSYLAVDHCDRPCTCVCKNINRYL